MFEVTSVKAIPGDIFGAVVVYSYFGNVTAESHWVCNFSTVAVA